MTPQECGTEEPNKGKEQHADNLLPEDKDVYIVQSGVSSTNSIYFLKQPIFLESNAT